MKQWNVIRGNSPTDLPGLYLYIITGRLFPGLEMCFLFDRSIMLYEVYVQSTVSQLYK